MKLIPGTTDVFTVSNPDGAAPPAICGTNSGEHSKKFFETVCDISRIFDTTFQSMMNAKLSKQRFCPFHEKRFVKRISEDFATFM